MRPGPRALAVLQEALPGASVVTVAPDVDYRTFPLVILERSGGTRSVDAPRLLSHPVLGMTVVSSDGPVAAEELYEEALDALYNAHGIRETRGATSVPSRYPDTWAVEGTVRVRVRR